VEVEVWRDVVGYEGKYRVSNRGRVENVRSGRILLGSPNSGGYVLVRLTAERGDWRMHYLHRLVCRAFNGPPPTPEHVVNHLNGHKLDCRPQNLNWCTRAENCAHASKLGLYGRLPGSRNPNARLTEALVVEMRRRSREGVSYTRLARDSGVSVSAAYRAIVGRSWRHVRDDALPAEAVAEVGERATSRAVRRQAEN
jgi:hypothetical protein